MKDIPNLRWLLMGVAVTFSGLRQMSFEAAMYGFAEIPVAWLFLMFSNPRTEDNRWDITLTFVALTGMWPIILLAMLASPPWQEKEWKERHADKSAESHKSDEGADT